MWLGLALGFHQGGCCHARRLSCQVAQCLVVPEVPPISAFCLPGMLGRWEGAWAGGGQEGDSESTTWLGDLGKFLCFLSLWSSSLHVWWDFEVNSVNLTSLLSTCLIPKRGCGLESKSTKQLWTQRYKSNLNSFSVIVISVWVYVEYINRG